MKIINAAVRSNGFLSKALASRRENGLNVGSIKRQSNRQMRQRLETSLRKEAGAYIVSENRQRMMDAWFANEWAQSAARHAEYTAAIAAAGARVVREVQVTSKVKLSPFQRKQVKVAVLAV